MAAIKVCIEVGEDGAISVGAEPSESGDQGAAADPGMMDMAQPPAGEDAERSYMRPAGSIEQALSIARDLLRSASQVGGAITAPPGGAEQQGSADAAFMANRGK